ncbi:transcription factor VIP1 isoform X1 [Cajanus cajan]|nr:transcription factor VIP1 isoform X1 [Cajanus cajan]XP_020233641.2 transcription factor VIP1 isoform X1 [Cajanus cajan]
MDTKRMLKCGSHHHHSHSDNCFRFITNIPPFNTSNLVNSNFPLSLTFLSLDTNDIIPMVVDLNKSKKQKRFTGIPHARHLRSLSVDSNFFYNFGFTNGENERIIGKSGSEQRVEHQRHNSVDRPSTKLFKVDSGMEMMDYKRKDLTLDKLPKLALVDPKQARSNRKSTIRSKSRNIRYATMLKRKILYTTMLKRKIRHATKLKRKMQSLRNLRNYPLFPNYHA